MSKSRLIPLAFLSVLVITVIGGLYIAICRSAAPKPEINVVLITLDTTRADRLGCYGYPKLTSPNLDKLAAESVQFDLAIAQAAVTPVSHASILTGLNPYNHGLRVLHGLIANSLDKKYKTLAEVWRSAGGRTAAFVSAFPVTAAFGLDQGFEHFDAHFPQADGNGLVSKTGIVSTGTSQRRADETTRAAIKWLNEKADPCRPLFMWVHYFDPHDPYLLPPRAYLDQFKPVSQRKDDVLRAIYDAEVFYMDFYTGRLLEALKQRGLWDNTMVVVVADHGEGLGDHDWWTHGILYQEQIRIPMIIRAAGMKGGLRVSSLVCTIDLMPTILEAAGVCKKLWPSMDGRSLLQVMRTGRTEKQRIAYSDSVNMLTYGRPDTTIKRDRKIDKLYCLMDEKYKLIFHQLRPANTEFYNLQADPCELKDITLSAPAEMQVMMEHLRSLDAFSDIMPGMTTSDLERLEKLRGLGYVE